MNRTEAEVHNILDAALSDDPGVRGAALQALVSRGGPEAMGSLWQALEDPDLGVRILAVESVAPGEEGEALLKRRFRTRMRPFAPWLRNG